MLGCFGNVLPCVTISESLRLIVQLIEDQDGADEDFWKQDFFAEERADDEYATESESEDEADTDFSGSVRLHSHAALVVCKRGAPLKVFEVYRKMTRRRRAATRVYQLKGARSPLLCCTA